MITLMIIFKSPNNPETHFTTPNQYELHPLPFTIYAPNLGKYGAIIRFRRLKMLLWNRLWSLAVYEGQ